MANRNAPASFTFEEWRVEFNQLAADVGDIESGITGSAASGSPTYTTVETALEEMFTDIDSIIDGTYPFTGLTVNGNAIIGEDDTDTFIINADFGSNLIPNADNTYNLGSSSKSWRNLYLGNTGSTSDTTGALIIEGGAGIGENLYVKGGIFEDGQQLASQGFAIAVSIALS